MLKAQILYVHIMGHTTFVFAIFSKTGFVDVAPNHRYRYRRAYYNNGKYACCYCLQSDKAGHNFGSENCCW